MALTVTQQVKILQYLGYPLRVLQPGYEFYSPILISRFQNLLPEAEAVVIDYLTKLDNVYQQIEDSQSRMLALGVGDIKINDRECNNLHKARANWVRKLSQAIAVPVGEAIEAGGVSAHVLSVGY